MSSPESTRPPDREAGRIWRFGDCEFDELRRELRVGNRLVDIEVKPLEVLHQLLLHSGEVVTKTELLDTVWSGVAVADGSLATAISKVRKLLGDTGNVIVTVPRVGYKLAVPVRSRTLAVPAWPRLQLEPAHTIPGRDQWRLERRLGLSPSSDVWLALHSKTHETRVFKFALDDLRFKGLKREVTVARLLRETLGDSSEFVRILEWNFETPPYFVESEYGGPNLEEWAEAQGGLGNVPWERRLSIFKDVVGAVAAAHRLDLLHKDLKPGNILIAASPDQSCAVKIADFGSASLLTPTRLNALGITNLGLTQTAGSGAATLTGTLMYVAPEVFAGQSPTAASDVYSLGVLLYQLAAGDFRKPLAPGWEANVEDPLLREDIAAAACGDPSRRLSSAAALGARLEALDRRRADRQEPDGLKQHATAAEGESGKLRTRRRWLALATLVVLAAGAASIGVFRRSDPGTTDARAVAVLPLRNTRSDSGMDFLRLALADEIATALTHAPGVQVRPLSASSQIDMTKIDLADAARRLRVDRVVTGQFIRDGDRLHVTLELVDVGNNHVIWRDSFEAAAESLIAAQVQIVLRVRRGLAPALGAALTGADRQPRNEQAYELYLRSSALPMEPRVNKQGLDMLERAVQLDGEYPPIWLALARRYYTEARYGSGDLDMMVRFETAIERALSLDPDYIPAAAALIVVRAERGDLIRAHQLAADLVGRRPDSLEAHFALSYVLRYAGLLNEAADRCEIALMLDRGMQTTSLRSCAKVFLLRADYPRTMNYVRLDQGADYAKALTIDMLMRQGRGGEALQVGSPNIPEWKSYDMLLACVGGRPTREIDALAARVQPSDDPELNYFAAAHLAHCDRVDVAVDLLKRAIARNYCAYPAMESDPLLARVRSQREYPRIRAAGQACQQAFLERRSPVTTGR